jgi:hypothetical protein
LQILAWLRQPLRKRVSYPAGEVSTVFTWLLKTTSCQCVSPNVLTARAFWIRAATTLA